MDMPASLPFSKSFDFASGAIGERFQNPFYKLKEIVLGAPLRKAVFEVKTFGSRIVSAAVQKRQDQSRNKSIDPLQNNLINSLLDNIDDLTVVADAAMNYLSAGMLPPRVSILLINLQCRKRHDSSIPDVDFLPSHAPS